MRGDLLCPNCSKHKQPSRLPKTSDNERVATSETLHDPEATEIEVVKEVIRNGPCRLAGPELTGRYSQS